MNKMSDDEEYIRIKKAEFKLLIYNNSENDNKNIIV
jgi:hypothetical protein